MIGFIKGTVVEATGNYILLETSGGVGYELAVSAFTVEEKGKIGDNVKLFTHLSVREDGVTLYGFSDLHEKKMFLRLISISGIGPKVATSILSGIRPDDIIRAIVSSDSTRLNRIKGIGKKTAERIILELKDKLKEEFDISGEDTVPIAFEINEDAVQALVGMGFSKQEAVAALGKIDCKGKTVEQIVIESLKGIYK